ncbi:MAG TPA: plastocyanin/azurin family copper-binding protein [Polyangia bacterium]|nr:plastocyanin/azurin family copper-binding protein [Polyangia bacterium]
MKQPLMLLACVLGAAIGCGGETPAPAPTPAPTPTPSSMPPPTTGATTHTVTVGPNGSMMFAPSQISINVGDTVEWNWPAGSLPHTVTSGTPGAPDGQFCSNGQQPSVQACSGAAYAMTGPATYSHTFSAAGSFPYFCQVHGALMTGMVTVNP